MTEVRKKSGLAFWTTVVLVAVLLYAASIGPAFWMWQNVFGRSDACWKILWILYAPVGLACEHGSVNAAVSSWVSLWADG